MSELSFLANRHAEVEKKIASIAYVTQLSFDEVNKRTKGRYLDLIYKAACISGKLMNDIDAYNLLSARSKAKFLTGSEPPELI